MAKKQMAFSILAKVLAGIEYEGGDFRGAPTLKSIAEFSDSQKSDLACQAAELLALLVQEKDIEKWCVEGEMKGYARMGAVQRLGHAVHDVMQVQFSAKGSGYNGIWGREAIVKHILLMLLDDVSQLDQDVLKLCLLSFARPNNFKPFLPYEKLLRGVENHLQTHEDLYELMVPLKKLEKHFQTDSSKNEAGKSLRILTTQMVEKYVADVALPPLEPGELWADACLVWYLKQLPERQAKWLDFLTFVSTSKASKPSKKWLKTAASLMAAIGEDVCIPLLEWVDFVGLAPVRNNSAVEGDPAMMNPLNAVVMKGIVWALTCQPEKAVLAALGKCADACFYKIPLHGPRSVKVGNACVQTLANINTLDSIAELSRLQSRVKHTSILKTINKALIRAAAHKGLSKDELAELAVPTFNLQPDGICAVQMGDFKANLEVINAQTIHLTWQHATGKTQKTVPKSIKETMPDELKALKQKIKDLKACLAAQKYRIEQLFIKNDQWDYKTWKTRYVDHPLISIYAKRLIWTFQMENQTFVALLRDGKWVDHQGKTRVPGKACKVSLWHPVEVDSEEVRKWRSFVQDHQITQPIKQAYREIYLLTHAERRTQTYSNRFAAHILKQHQLLALCQQRGWQYRLMGNFDAFYEPTLNLPGQGLKVTLGIAGASGEADNLSESGIFLSVTSDQVSFLDAEGPEPLNLATLSKRVFSECMRDVDLFVSVCSVGNDPNWVDHIEGGAYYNYCQSYNLGELSEMGKTRRAVLETLIPQLKIADQCQLDDRFLHIQGRLRNYKIHMGSGNVFMEPNNQYLCIVAAKPKTGSASNQIFLPFEGDSTLALILSKAWLLAADEKIKDPVILEQINRP